MDLKKLSRLSFRLALMTLLGSLIFTASVHAAEKKGINITAGQTVYTQFSLFYERNCHVTTNYRRGTLVPVNTPVKFVKAGDYTIVVTLPDGQRLTVRNIIGYSGETMEGIFNRTFASQPVDLSSFSEIEKKAIQAGEVKVGMSKAATLVAMGYPPKHKTPSLDAKQWQYWESRFDTIIVHFNDGHVTEIQD